MWFNKTRNIGIIVKASNYIGGDVTQRASLRIESLKDLCLTTALDRVTIVPAPAYAGSAERADRGGKPRWTTHGDVCGRRAVCHLI